MHKRVILIFVTSFGLLVAMASCRFHERYPLSINLQSLPSSKHTTANEGCHFRFVLERDGSLSYEGSLSRDVNGDSFGILKIPLTAGEIIKNGKLKRKVLRNLKPAAPFSLTRGGIPQSVKTLVMQVTNVFFNHSQIGLTMI